VLVLAVPVSLSRGGVVSLATGLACFALLRVLSRRRSRLSGPGLVGVLAAFGAAGLLVVTVLPAEARQRVLSLAGITSDQSGSYRLALWGDTLRVAASSPVVGSGFGAYEDALPRFKTAAAGFRVQHAENDHLELLAEGGFVAALLGTAAILVVLLLGLKTLRSTEHRLARSLLAAALAAWASAYVHAAFDFNFHIPSNVLMVALLAGLCASAALPATPEPGLAHSRLPLFSPGLLVLAASLLVALLTPWSEPRWEPGRLARASAPTGAGLRRAALDMDLCALLRREPARATAWVRIGWLRLPTSRQEALALAEWGVGLDPCHEELARASASLREISP
jgi:hypothetical protein